MKEKNVAKIINPLEEKRCRRRLMDLAGIVSCICRR